MYATCTVPSLPTATRGIHWSLFVTSWLTRAGGDHVLPLSHEWDVMISASPVPFAASDHTVSMQPLNGPVERSIAPSTLVPTRNFELGSGEAMGFTAKIFAGCENVAPSSADVVRYALPPELMPPRITYTVPSLSAK